MYCLTWYCKLKQDWPVHGDVFNHPPPRHPPWHPIWSDLLPVDMSTQWKENWQSTLVTNHAIVVDPTTRQPGFDLPRCSGSLLNRFLTRQGPCKASLYKWGLMQSPNCSCGEPQNNVDCGLQTKFETDDSTWCCQLVEFCGDYSTCKIVIIIIKTMAQPHHLCWYVV